MTRPAVTIYVSDWCPYCQRAIGLLTQKNIAFNEINVEEDVKFRDEMIARSNRRTVPQIFIGDKHIGGCEDLCALERQRRVGSANSGGRMNEVRTAEAETNVGGVQVSLQSVYLKDCSYESPNGPRVPNNQAWEPKFQLNMNTSAEELSPEVREVLLTITARGEAGRSDAVPGGSQAGGVVLDYRRIGGRFEALDRQLLSQRAVSIMRAKSFPT